MSLFLFKKKFKMINISFKDGQGLGNQLWMFAAAKYYRRVESKIKHLWITKIQGNNFLILDNEYKYNYAIEDYDHTKEIEIFNERIFYDHDLKYNSSDYDERV